MIGTTLTASAPTSRSQATHFAGLVPISIDFTNRESTDRMIGQALPLVSTPDTGNTRNGCEQGRPWVAARSNAGRDQIEVQIAASMLVTPVSGAVGSVETTKI